MKFQYNSIHPGKCGLQQAYSTWSTSFTALMRQLKTSCTTNTSLQRVMQWIRLWSVERAASTALSSWPWNWIHLLCEGSTSPQWSGRRCRGATQLKATFPKHAQTAPADTARGRQPSFNLSLHGTMARQVCCVLRTKKACHIYKRNTSCVQGNTSAHASVNQPVIVSSCEM